MTSRTFSVYASIQDRADILYAAGLPFDGSAEEMLCKRFHLEKKDILPRGCDEKDVHYIMRHSVCILSQAAVARCGYQEYLSRFGLGQKKVGIFDFVSTGTCQMCLEKILGISMKGYYFERIMDSHTRKRGLVIEDFVHTHEPHYESSNYFLLESWIKALHPSIDYVFPDGSVGLPAQKQRHFRLSGDVGCAHCAAAFPWEREGRSPWAERPQNEKTESAEREGRCAD